MNDFRKFKVWQRAHSLLLQIYELSATFPANERYTLTAQLRRAALSIPPTWPKAPGDSPEATSAALLITLPVHPKRSSTF